MISAHTRVFALLGDPVEHSLSPLIQNAAARATEMDGVYVALRCDVEDVPGFMPGPDQEHGGIGAGRLLELLHDMEEGR